MSYLESLFDELIYSLANKRRLNYNGIDPVFYLVFSPKDVIRLKNKMFQFKSKLINEGFEPHELSMTDLISDILQNHSLFKACLDSEKEDPFQFKEINQTIQEMLLENRPINSRILEKLSNLPDNGVLLITDLESLHPYLYMSAIESELIGKIDKPVIIFYPGKRMGDSKLSFLGIHPEIGNYRSIHIGGLQ